MRQDATFTFNELKLRKGREPLLENFQKKKPKAQ
jgi:hypothetical protein